MNGPRYPAPRLEIIVFVLSPRYINNIRFSLSMEKKRLTRNGTAEPVSRDQFLRHELGQGNIDFPCSFS